MVLHKKIMLYEGVLIVKQKLPLLNTKDGCESLGQAAWLESDARVLLLKQVLTKLLT
jgi:hypothetical protein